IWTNGYTANITAVANDLSWGGFTIPGPSTSIAWVQPSSVSWGPANTLTVAGYAQNGTGTVQMTWRDASANGPWNVVAWQPTPDANHTWSNTIPTSNYCHDYSVYSTYNGVTSTVFTYRGRTSGYCSETTRIIWIQPQSTAGFGPPGSLVVAGSATGAPSGTGGTMYYRDVTAGGWWTVAPYVAPTDANGIWYNSIANADPYHQYAVYVSYDVVSSPTCTYAGTNGPTNC
ncbi:MAG: hypothetical protein JO306_12870, partial [Gemmatimonadetes bacterium]|nr:hypothetical protein [Gemmatimonadota bacterium]